MTAFTRKSQGSWLKKEILAWGGAQREKEGKGKEGKGRESSGRMKKMGREMKERKASGDVLLPSFDALLRPSRISVSDAKTPLHPLNSPPLLP